MLAAGILATVLLLLAVGYRFWVVESIRREVQGRLADDDVRALLTPYRETGNPSLPACLLLHGFGGSPQDLMPIAVALSGSGRTVSAPCLRGHCGASPAELRDVSAEDWLADAGAALRELKRTHASVDLVGFSMGALLALTLAEDKAIRRLVLLSPFTEVPHKWYYIMSAARWQHLLSGVIPYVRKPSPGQINNEAGMARYEPSYLHLPVEASMTLNALSKRVWDSAVGASQPTLVIYSTGDAVSSPTQMRVKAALLCRRPEDRVVRLTESNHILAYDLDRELVIEETLRHLSIE